MFNLIEQLDFLSFGELESDFSISASDFSSYMLSLEAN